MVEKKRTKKVRLREKKSYLLRRFFALRARREPFRQSTQHLFFNIVCDNNTDFFFYAETRKKKKRVRERERKKRKFFDAREDDHQKRKKRERRGAARSKTFPSLSLSLQFFFLTSLPLFVSISREKRTTEKTRESPRRRRERDFLLSLSPVSSRGGCRHSQNDEQKKEEESIFFFSGKLNWSIKELTNTNIIAAKVRERRRREDDQGIYRGE